MKSTYLVRKICFGLAGALCLSWTATAWGEEKALTLLDALSLALKNNGELQALQDEKGIREAGRIKASLLPNPVVELENSTGALTGNPTDNTVSLGLTQEFLTFGKRGKRMEVADKELSAYEFQLADKQRLLIKEVKTAFYDVLLAQKKSELAEQSIELSRRLSGITRQMLAAGDVGEVNLSLAMVEVARSEALGFQVEAELRAARSRLQALLGLAEEDALKIMGSFATDLPQESLEELKALALALRPDMKAIEKEQARADSALGLAKSERFPNVTAGLSIGYEDESFEVGRLESREKSYFVGAKISMPIPLFDRNQAEIKEATARRSSAGSRRLFAGKTIEREVEGAFGRAMAAEKSVSVYTERALPGLKENVQLMEEAYKLGEVGIQAIIEEQKKFTEVHSDYLTALYTLQSSLIELESVIGEAELKLNGGAR